MSALLSVELRRAFARRLTRVMALLALAAILIGAVSAFFSHQAGDAAALRAAAAARAAEVERCVALPQVPGPEKPLFEGPAPGSAERRDFCGRSGYVPFTRDKRLFLTEFTGIARGVTVPIVLLSWLLGASFIGAEWRAGTIGTLLTWEPRRARVMLAKALATAITTFCLAVAVQLVLSGALLPTVFARGTTIGADAAWLSTMVGVVVRGAALAAMASLIGFAVGSIGRNAAAALGAGFVYLAILEGGLLGSNFPWLRRWLMVGNSIVFVSGKPTFDIAGRGVVGAGIVLACYAIGMTLIATTVFSRRDVT